MAAKKEKKILELDEVKANAKVRASLNEDLHRIAELNAQKKDIEAELDMLKAGTVAKYKQLGIDGIILDGMVHMEFNGTNVTVAGGRVRDAMLAKGIDPKIIEFVLGQATKRTPYTTITSRPWVPDADPFVGGMTGESGDE